MFSVRSISLKFLGILALSGFFVGCASGTFKARQEQREKLASSSGMYCEFISGDLFPDLDVELSMSMAKRCDSTKSFSITNYKNSSNQSGVVYCCSTGGGRRASMSRKASPAPSTQNPAPKEGEEDSLSE